MIKKLALYWLFMMLFVMSLSGCMLPRETSEDIQVEVPTVIPASTTSATSGDAGAEFEPTGSATIQELVLQNYPEGGETSAQQAGTASIFIEPSVQDIAPNEVTTAEVWVRDVTDLAGLDIELRFDPTILRVIDASTGQDGVQIQPGDFLSPDFVQTNNADNETGIIRYIMTQVAPTEPADGTGLIMLITFEAIASGGSGINFANVQLVNVDALLISLNQQEAGQINVASGPVAEATATTAAPTAQAALPSATPQESEPPTATPVTGQPAASPTIPPDDIVENPPPTATAQPGESTGAPQSGQLPTEVGSDDSQAVGLPLSAPIPVVQPIAIPPGSTTGFCYRVEPGESIYALAQKYATTPWAINLVNDLSPAYYVYAQQTVFIPTSQPNYGPNIYLVEPGDTLANIAEQCKLPVSMLIRVNNLEMFIKRNHLDPAGPVITLPMGETFNRGDGYSVVLAQDTVLVEALIIPIPPFPPPTRYGYPAFPIVPVP